jgi:hypothetical protein
MLLEIDEDAPDADLALALDILDSSAETILARLLAESAGEEPPAA